MVIKLLHTLSTSLSPLKNAAHNLGDRRDENITQLIEEETLKLWIICIVIFLAGCAFLLFSYTVIHRHLANKKDAKKKLLKQKYTQFLAELTSGAEADSMLSMLDSTGEKTLTLDYEDLKDLSHRQVLLEGIKTLHRQFNGEIQTRLRATYLMMGFASDALKSLKSKKPQRRAAAIKELSQFDIRDAYSTIFSLVNDPSQSVRDAAIKGRAKLDTHPLLQLKELKYELTDWQKSLIHFEMSKISREDLPRIHTYLNPEKEDQYSFIAKMSNEYRQKEMVAPLLSHITHKSTIIRNATYEALSNFPSEQVKNALLEQLTGTTAPEEQNNLLKAISEMLDIGDLQLLQDVLTLEDRDLVIEAARQLLKLSPGFADEIPNDYTHMEWVAHAIDPKISAS